ncbi:MAG: beta-1,6-N-acetylglucosaminyltransferase [Mobilicoccus sp.]|nr:beta-1,6-N-acetylglucosaminyltransferase [Mobilicoccus sp.]
MGAPEFCYVVLAHEPVGIARLVSRIRELSPRSSVVVRYEQGRGFDADELHRIGAATLVSSIPVKWGAWTLTEAMLEAFAAARERTRADYLVMISGQDYPIRDLQRWESEVVGRVPDALLAPIAEHRDDWRYRWSFVTPPLPRHPQVQRVARHLGWQLGRVTRPVLQILPRFAGGDRRWSIGLARPWVRTPDAMPIVKASQWMVLSGRAVDRMLALHRDRPELARFFRTVRISDESYVQSVLSAQADLRVEHTRTTSAYFPPETPSPVWLDEDVLTMLSERDGAPFARKLAPDASPAVVAAADRLVENDRAAAAPDEGSPTCP